MKLWIVCCLLVLLLGNIAWAQDSASQTPVAGNSSFRAFLVDQGYTAEQATLDYPQCTHQRCPDGCRAVNGNTEVLEGCMIDGSHVLTCSGTDVLVHSWGTCSDPPIQPWPIECERFSFDFMECHPS